MNPALFGAQHRLTRRHNPVCNLVQRLALPFSGSVMALGKPLSPELRSTYLSTPPSYRGQLTFVYTRLHTGLCIPKHLIKAAIPLHYTQLVLSKDLLTQHRSAVKNQPAGDRRRGF